MPPYPSGAVRSRDQFLSGFRAAQRGGYLDAWLARNAPDIYRSGLYVQPGPRPVNFGIGGTGLTAGDVGQGPRVLGSPNYALINAYYTQPAVRAYMDSLGISPQVSAATVQSLGDASGTRRMSTTNPNVAWARYYAQAYGTSSPHATAMLGGTGAVATGGPAYQVRPSQPAAAAGSLQSAPWYDVGGLPGLITSTLGREIGSPSGLPVGMMQSRIADDIARQARREAAGIRESFARRGQTGTEAERAALQEAEQRAFSERLGQSRDIMIQDALQRLQNRFRALGYAVPFVRGERQDLVSRLRDALSLAV